MAEESHKAWVLTGSLDNFRATRERDFRIAGMKERQRRRARARGGVSGSSDPADRVRTLLLRGDNQLKHGRKEAALESFAEALELEGVDPNVRALVERRIESLRTLLETS